MNKKHKILVILNPAARGERAKALREKIASLSHHVVVRSTSSPGDARGLAARAVSQGYGTIVAAGGDGTINEVVNGIGGADVQFGILPVGTMNVFAAELGIPQNNLPKAWQVIEAGCSRLVDLPRPITNTSSNSPESASMPKWSGKPPRIRKKCSAR